MIRLSIILPVYNVAPYIADCLESLIDQDIPEEEYEIVCVNDGSMDNSREVIKSYQTLHNNIALYEQKNSGVCVARNNGMRKSNGKYIWFIDPDDMICSNCLGTILRLLEDSQADLLEMDYETCNEETHYDKRKVKIEIEGTNKNGSSGSGCLSVCLSSYLKNNNITWDERLSYGEDYLWAFQTKYRKHKSIYTNAKVYIYRQRKSSAMHSSGNIKKQEKHFSDMLLLSEIYNDEYKRCKKEGLGENVLDNVKKRQQLCVEGALLCLLKMCLSDKEVRKRLRMMKEKGIYPYPFLLWNFFTKDAVNPLRNRIFTFGFPIQLYYLFMCCIYRLIHGKALPV